MLFKTYDRIEVIGLMPQRSLMRLRRAGIELYDVKKTDKNVLRFSVHKRDTARVLAIYPKTSQYENGYSPYTVRVLGRGGIGRYVDFCKKRMGFVLGLLLFCMGVLFADGLVFGVEFSASKVYAREAVATLEEFGVKRFCKYKAGNEDLICSRLLALDGVEFCSVKKSGMKIVVEMRLGGEALSAPIRGDMKAKHTGEITAITVMRGMAQKQAGEKILVGETLVGGWQESQDGTRSTVDVVARVSIACTYEKLVVESDEEKAFALAYLDAGLNGEEILSNKSVEKTEQGFIVRLEYVATESWNY